jgi:hypothetical protein
MRSSFWWDARARPCGWISPNSKDALEAYQLGVRGSQKHSRQSKIVDIFSLFLLINPSFCSLHCICNAKWSYASGRCALTIARVVYFRMYMETERKKNTLKKSWNRALPNHQTSAFVFPSLPFLILCYLLSPRPLCYRLTSCGQYFLRWRKWRLSRRPCATPNFNFNPNPHFSSGG